MDIFLSWHGQKSHALAEILRGWLPTVLPYARPWLSSEDIGKGKPWDPALAKRLEATSHAIVCVTAPQVARAPWVNFEAGAVSKYVDHARVSPLLVGVSPEDIGGLPLSRFQCTRFNKGDVGRLLRSINAASSSRIESRTLDRNLRNTWRQLQDDVGSLDLAEESRNGTVDHSNNDRDGRNVRLAAIEERILEFIADNPDSHLELADVRDQVDENHVRVQHHLDRLVRAGLLDDHWGTEYPTTYTSTEKGRAYLVDHDLV